MHEYNDNGCIYLGNWLYIGLIKLWCYWRDALKKAYWRKRGIPQYGCGYYSGEGIQIPQYDTLEEERFVEFDNIVILPSKVYFNARGIQIPIKESDGND